MIRPNMPGNISGVAGMNNRQTVKIDRYNYASGRIRALEVQLMDAGQTNRLYEARTVEDIGRVMADCGYPSAADPETALTREMVSVYQLMQNLFPDQDFVDALIQFHDFHNLKVILKSLIPAWPRQTAAAVQPIPPAGAQEADLPESSSLASAAALESLFLKPALVDSNLLFQAVRDRRRDLVPAWIYDEAVQVSRRYLATYDVSEIDMGLDQAASRKAVEYAQRLQFPFFTQYLARRFDLINLGLLLRTRFLHSGTTTLRQQLLTGGTLPAGQIADLYDAPASQILAFLQDKPYAVLSQLVESFGAPGTAARFGLLADNLLIDLIRSARWALRGPDVLLAYLIAREMEIKNIRIALTCLRNGLPAAQARELARDSYLNWR